MSPVFACRRGSHSATDTALRRRAGCCVGQPGVQAILSDGDSAVRVPSDGSRSSAQQLQRIYPDHRRDVLE